MAIRNEVYTIRIESAEIDGGYIAEVLDFPGCLAQGESLEETLDNILSALLLVLEVQGQQQVRVGGHDRPEEDRLPADLPVTIRMAA
jgi:predicted RNase H-like HicB family nuclease